MDLNLNNYIEQYYVILPLPYIFRPPSYKKPTEV